MFEELGEREREVLRAIVSEYIVSGGPVGSSQLARKGDFDVSPATLRNIMADLEELGYLEKPHTSAGRVPTDRGYRFFVDTVVRVREPTPKDRQAIEQGIQDIGVNEALQDASKVLHSLSHHAGVVLVPRVQSAIVQRIEFVRLREDRVLAILLSQGGQVQNKIISVDFPVTSDELAKAANYLTELLHEQPMEDVRRRLSSELDQERAQYDALMQKALKLGIAATDLPPADRVLIEGTGSLLATPEFADVERIRTLVRTLEEKQRLLTLLDQVQRAKELRIYIGTESDFSPTGDLSVVASPYSAGDQILGAVGVIGPTRMNYQRVIPLVNFTAEVLSRVLDK